MISPIGIPLSGRLGCGVFLRPLWLFVVAVTAVDQNHLQGNGKNPLDREGFSANPQDPSSTRMEAGQPIQFKIGFSAPPGGMGPPSTVKAGALADTDLKEVLGPQTPTSQLGKPGDGSSPSATAMDQGNPKTGWGHRATCQRPSPRWRAWLLDCACPERSAPPASPNVWDPFG